MPVKIAQFEAENVKRIKAVQIVPLENGLTVIGGRNGQDKTSGLAAIMWALGGDLYDQRRSIGQIADQKAKHARELPSYEGVPDEPVSAYELIQRQQDILARNGENQRKRERAA